MNQNNRDDKTRTHHVLKSGAVVAHYRIVDKIGAGGMGEVYLAEDTKLKRNVAIKFLPSHLVTNQDVRTRFVREAQTVARLNHPNIVSIYDVSEFEGRPYYVMELIEGESLHHFAHDKSLPTEMIIEYALQICQGLSEAHRAGIVHRDIKAANIAIDKQGRVRLLDFGLAAVAGDEKLTKTGSTLGTVAYMSPEQVSGREIDHRSDLFSLGIVLYELIAGRTPFRRDSDGATLKAIMEDSPEPLTRYKSDVPEKLQQIIFELLEKDKEIRYQSAEGVIAHLKRLTYDSQQPATAAESGTKKPKRLIPILVSAFAVLLIGLWAIFFRSSAESEDSKSPVLVVLPFENLGSPDDEYFADGITDEISSRLSTIDGMQVISRSSAAKFKNTDKSIEEIGRELRADYLLEGSIRWDKSGEIERIRITPRLTQTSNNFQLWSDNYQRNLTQIFAVQAEIADQIAEQLGLTLLDQDQIVNASYPTSNMEAYNYYLRGLELAREGIFVANLKEAIKMFDSAIVLDPEFALAWAYKSIASTDYEFSYVTGDNVSYAKEAKEAAERALALDPHLPSSHIAMGSYYNYMERDYDKALAEFAKAESEVTSDANLSEGIGVVKMRQGKWWEALSNFEKAAQIDPLNTRRYYWLATCNSLIRDYSAAEKYVNRALALAPDNADAVFFKLLLNLLNHGSIEFGERSIDDIVGDVGFADANTWELGVSNATGLWRFFPQKYRSMEMISALRKLRSERSDHIIYMNIAEIFDLAGEKDSAQLYFDSSRMVLSHLVDDETDDFHVFAALGITYARMGMAESAIAAGIKAKELMSVDDCHW